MQMCTLMRIPVVVPLLCVPCRNLQRTHRALPMGGALEGSMASSASGQGGPIRGFDTDAWKHAQLYVSASGPEK